MRGTTRQARSQTSIMVEMLEQRSLLSADWVGTWQVQGVDLTMRSLPTTGGLAVSSPALTVAITQTGADTYSAVLTAKVKGKPTVTETRTLTADAEGLFADYTGQDIAANGQVINWRYYIRMMEVDADVKMFDMTSVGITTTNGAQRIHQISMFSGVASQEKLQLVTFPYPGNYSFQGFRLVADAQNNVVTVDANYSPRTAVITQTAGKAYNIATQDIEGTTSVSPFLDKTGRLSQVFDVRLADNNSHVRYLQQYYRGPHGRLYFRTGGMEANTNPNRTDAAGAVPLGQILSGTSWVGYSDTAPYNFAPILDPATIALNNINEDQTANPGTSVRQIRQASTITDWNGSNSRGIAIVGLDSRRGTWEFSTNGGAAWQPVGKVSTGRALLLADSPQNLIRFVPKADFNGTLPKAMRFRAWDQSAGANGTFASAAKAGKLTAFSTTRNYATLQVLPVNDFPILSGTLPELTYTGSPVRIASGLKISDVDNKTLSNASIVVSGTAAGDLLTYTGRASGITVDPISSPRMLLLTGVASLSAYLSAIRSITFTADPAVAGPRTISIQVNDGAALPTSNVLTQTVQVPAAAPLPASPFANDLLTPNTPALL